MTATFLMSVVLAATGTPPASGPQTAPAPRSGDDRVVCRRDDEVGTRLGQRTCLTRAEWRRREEEARHEARGMMDGASRAGGVAAPTPEGGPN